ncbi:MFS transporter [Acinetobacter sp. MD2(2019)]|uniref:MFS transporter n=1 Tax=Acinetobacter sp. MD2(2019) TaxID=2605273 RepID=UPI002D1EB5B2|nr:MFS transporter [Acinetobacter sp. MD2(2019)]MEB3754229.1 MFS transporter [Acinetobacter sp. MD2(2019)]
MNYRVRVACIYLLGFFIDLINMFIANIAYPEIGRNFDASITQLAWISNSYILGLTLVIPLSSWLGKKVGNKRTLILSLGLFIVSTCGVAASTSISQMITWRCFQGIGGGLLIPIGQSMSYALYQRHERAKLSAAIMLVALFAPAISPTIGGVIVDHLSWRWVFLATLPLAILTLIITAYWLKTDVRTDLSPQLDLWGFIMSCFALAFILIGLTIVGEYGHFYRGVFILMIGFIWGILYIRNSLKKKNPLINLHLVKNPLLQIGMLIYQFVPGIFTGVNVISVLYLQNLLNMHASTVGTMMLPWSLASFLAIRLTSKKFNILGPRPLLITGCIIHAFGIGLLALTSHTTTISIFLLAFALMGFGGSLCSSTAQSAAFLQVKNDEMTDASVLWNINRQLSFCFGITIISLLFNLISKTNLSIEHVYHLCFLLAACSAIVPILFCFRIANQEIILRLNKESK